MEHQKAIADSVLEGPTVVRTVKIESPEDLPKVLEIVHDAWLDLSGITLSDRDNSLVLPISLQMRDAAKRTRLFGRSHRQTVPLVLRIDAVTDYRIEDRARVGGAYLNEVVFDPGASIVSITSDMPVAIHATVQRFGLAVEEPHRV